MIAQLPTIVIAAFQSPEDIRESWGVELYQLWKDRDPEHSLTNRARALADRPSRPIGREVYGALLSSNGRTHLGQRPHRNIPVRGSDGAVLFREQDRIGAVTFTIPKTILNPRRRDALKEAMVQILDGADPKSH